MTSDPRKGSNHGETESFLEILLSKNIRPNHELSIGDARAQLNRLVLQHLERVDIDFAGITKELTVPSVDTKGMHQFYFIYLLCQYLNFVPSLTFFFVFKIMFLLFIKSIKKKCYRSNCYLILGT